MASGDTLFVIKPQQMNQLSTSQAAYSVLTGGSTPAEKVPVLLFVDNADKYADFYGVMPNTYGGGGLTCIVIWSSLGTSGNCLWNIAFRAMEDDAEDIDSAHTYTYNQVAAATPSAAGEVGYDSITFTDGADMDTVNSGDFFIMRVWRDGDNASDTVGNSCYLWAIEVRET
jgi:hypothetical protein